MIQFYCIVQQWCGDSAVYQSTKDGNITIHPEKRFKGPEGTNPLWTHMTAN